MKLLLFTLLLTGAMAQNFNFNSISFEASDVTVQAQKNNSKESESTILKANFGNVGDCTVTVRGYCGAKATAWGRTCKEARAKATAKAVKICLLPIYS